MKALYLLVVDKAWAKLYKTSNPAQPLALVYHQALFGGARAESADAEDELARSLCRLLRADRLTGKYGRLAMLASPRMLAALRQQYDGDWTDVITGHIGNLPARYTDEDLGLWLQRLLTEARQPDAPEEKQGSAQTSASSATAVRQRS